MRKVYVAFLISLFLSVIAFQRVGAQETVEDFNYEKAYQDYIYTQNIYSKNHADYLLARGQYLQAGTLAAQTKARDATSLMLQSRDDVMTTYLTAVRLRLSESTGVTDSTKEAWYTRVDNEISWYEDHKSRLPSAGTLDDLVNDSDDAVDQFDEITEGLIYEGLTTITIGKVVTFRDQVTDILERLKTKIAEVKANGDIDTTIIDRWVLETENKLTRSIEKQVEAQGLISDLQDPKKKDKQNIYNDAISRLQESTQFLKEANNFNNEIIQRIKREDK